MSSLLALWAMLALARLTYAAARAQADALVRQAGLDLHDGLSLRSYAAMIERCVLLLDTASSEACRLHAAGHVDDAGLALAAVQRGADELVPNLRARLRVWGEVAARLSAAAPVEPLRARDLCLVRLCVLAQAEEVAAPLLGTLLRLRVRVTLLRWGLSFVWRILRRERVPAPGRAWTRFEAAGGDLGTLACDSVSTYAALLRSNERILHARPATA